MIEGARWRTWVFYNIPLILFIVGLLFPFYWMIVTSFRPDSELYRPWNAANYTPFWTLNPTLVHIRELLTETLFSTWMMNTMLIATVSTIISLAHSLHLKVVAEGVEDEATLERLRSLGCDMVQGFLLSRPLAADDVVAWMRAPGSARAMRESALRRVV